MKRLAISEYDESGNKWCNSPHHKEVKTDFFPDKGFPVASKQEADAPPNFHIDNKLRRDKFYDFFRRATINGEPRINIDELNKNLTIKIDELPDSSKVSLIFEDLDSKSSLASRGKKNWSEQEIIFFIWLIMNYCYLNKLNYMDLDEKQWDKIAEIFPGRSGEQCKLRWQSLLKMNLSKAPWTQEEDEILVQVINDKGPKKWKEIAIELNKRLGNIKIFRQGKQCRERWINHLDPQINRGAWTPDEDIKLLEIHLTMGKRWAEIAKILKSRTENSVKNRWNSLIKKYKSDYSFDLDSVSSSSQQSSNSVTELERKISEVLINQKKKQSANENSSPDQGQIQEVSEEDENESPESSSDLSVEANSVKSEAQPSDSDKKFEEEKSLEKKNSFGAKANNKKKTNFPVDINRSKSTLMDLVTQDMEARQPQRFPTDKKDNAAPIFPQANKNLQDNISLQNLLQNNMFGLNNAPGFVPGLIQPPQDTLNNANTLTLLNQLNMNNVNPFSTLANDMLNLNIGLWKASPPTFNGINNLFNQNLQQNDLASNILGMYTAPRTLSQQPNTSSLTSLFPNSQQQLLPDQPTLTLQNSLEAAKKQLENNNNNNTNNNNNNNNKMHTEDKESGSMLRYVEKPLDQLIIPEHPSSLLQHAIVDREAGHIFFLSPVNKDNFAQNKNNNLMLLNNNYNGMDLFGNTPPLNGRSFASPTMNNASLFTNSLNQLASLGLGRPSISPNLGLLQGSPNFLGQNFNVERKSNEWTPESTSKTPLSILNDRSRMLGQMNQAENNAANIFPKRLMPQDRSKNSSISTSESLKFDSPSSSLEPNQLRGLSFRPDLNKSSVRPSN